MAPTGAFVLFTIRLVKLSPCVNFTNILRAAYAPISLHKKLFNLNFGNKVLKNVGELRPIINFTNILRPGVKIFITGQK
jgi:hypothetical protein